MRIGMFAPSVCVESSKALLRQVLATLHVVGAVYLVSGFAAGSLGVLATPARQHRAT